MSFILILSVTLIPFVLGLTLFLSERNKFNRSIGGFLLLLFIWQLDVAILYSKDFFSADTIEFLFRLLRFGPIMIMPIMYYFAVSVHLMNTGGKKNSLYNDKILVLLIVYSIVVYLANFTSLGISGMKLVDSTYYYPVYGTLNLLFMINIILVLINTSLLIWSNSQTTKKEWKNLFYFLAFSAYFIFINGILSGFLKTPLYFSIFNSVIATIIIFAGYYSVNNQVTKGINKKLIEQSKFLSTILDAYPDYIFVMDNERTVTLVNRALSSLLGIEHEEIVQNETNKKMQKLLETIDLDSGEAHTVRRADGLSRKIEWSSLDMDFDDQSSKLYIGIDVTDRLQNEEMLLKTEKLRVLGELAAGVAHEIRNPLTSIKGFIKLLAEKNHDDIYYLDIVSDEIDRINDVVGELLFMAKPQASGNQISIVDVRKTIQDVKVLLDTNAIINKVSIDLEFCGAETTIHTVEHLLKQVLFNVLKNSVEALESGGRIRIKVETLPEERLRIRVIDNGCGISKSRLKSIGEPFFTTKVKGIGLGLMICFKIIKELKGEMSIKSVEKVGTIVDIILPRK